MSDEDLEIAMFMNMDLIHAERAAEVAAGIAAAFDDDARGKLAAACGASDGELTSMHFDDHRRAGMDRAREMLKGGL